MKKHSMVSVSESGCLGYKRALRKVELTGTVKVLKSERESAKPERISVIAMEMKMDPM